MAEDLGAQYGEGHGRDARREKDEEQGPLGSHRLQQAQAGAPEVERPFEGRGGGGTGDAALRGRTLALGDGTGGAGGAVRTHAASSSEIWERTISR